MKKQAIYKLINPPPIGEDDKGRKVIPLGEKVIKLIDDIVEDGVTKTICAVKGEPSIYLADHQDKSRKKKGIATITIKYGAYQVKPGDVHIAKFLEKSNFSNPNDVKRPLLRKVDFNKEAKESSQSDIKLAKAVLKIQEELPFEKIEEYVIGKRLFTQSQIDNFGEESIKSSLVRMLGKPSEKYPGKNFAEEFLNDVESPMITRINEMIKAKEKGAILLDSHSRNVVFASTKGKIVHYGDKDPYKVLAEYTFTEDGQQAYQYITEGKNASGGKVSKGSDSSNDIPLDELVKKAIRLGVIDSGKTGFRFQGKLIGKDEVKAVEHFNNYQEKISLLISDIESAK